MAREPVATPIPGSAVGYRTCLSDKTNPRFDIEFTTDGILFAEMQG